MWDKSFMIYNTCYTTGVGILTLVVGICISKVAVKLNESSLHELGGGEKTSNNPALTIVIHTPLLAVLLLRER